MMVGRRPGPFHRPYEYRMTQHFPYRLPTTQLWPNINGSRSRHWAAMHCCACTQPRPVVAIITIQSTLGLDDGADLSPHARMLFVRVIPTTRKADWWINSHAHAQSKRRPSPRRRRWRNLTIIIIIIIVRFISFVQTHRLVIGDT